MEIIREVCARGAVEDLEKAFQAAEQSVAKTPGDHPYHAKNLLSGTEIGQLRFKYFGDPEDPQNSSKSCKEGVAAKPQSITTAAMELYHLSIYMGTVISGSEPWTTLTKLFKLLRMPWQQLPLRGNFGAIC